MQKFSKEVNRLETKSEFLDAAVGSVHDECVHISEWHLQVRRHEER